MPADIFDQAAEPEAAGDIFDHAEQQSAAAVPVPRLAAPAPNAGLAPPPSPGDIAARINPQPVPLAPAPATQPVVSGFPIDQRVPNAVRDTASEYVQQGPKKVFSGARKLAESGALSNLGYMTPPLPHPVPQDTKEALTGASEAMEGLGVTTAPLVGGAALMTPLRVGGSLLAGYATSQVAKKTAESMGLSPEAVRFSENLGWFIPVAAGLIPKEGKVSTVPGEAGVSGRVGPVEAGVAQAPEGGVTVATRAGDKTFRRTFGGKAEAVPSIEPQTIKGEPGAVSGDIFDQVAETKPAAGETKQPKAETPATPEEIHAQAKEQQPDLVRSAAEVADQVPGARIVDPGAKTPESIQRKLDQGKEITDAARAQIVVPDDEAKKKAEQAVAANLPASEISTIKAENLPITQVKLPDGQELQIATEKEHETQQATHDLYAQKEEAAAAGDKDKAQELQEQIDQAHAEAANADRGTLNGKPVQVLKRTEKNWQTTRVRLEDGTERDIPNPQFKRQFQASTTEPAETPKQDEVVQHVQDVQPVTSGTPSQPQPKHGAIAVDLDDTLAKYGGFKGPSKIGVPIQSTVDHVKQLLADGKEVWVYTARAGNPESIPAIKDWTKEHIGQELPVTNIKYPQFHQFIDDRAVKPEELSNEQQRNGAEPVSANAPESERTENAIQVERPAEVLQRQPEEDRTGSGGRIQPSEQGQEVAGKEAPVSGQSDNARSKGEGKAVEPKYKFGNTQANIPGDSEAAKALATARARISSSDIKPSGMGGNEKGLETEPHVTVRYGIQGDDTESIKNYLSQQAPFEAKLGKTDKFPPSDHSDGAAVIIAPIEAPELHRMNAELEKHGDFTEPSFPEFRPHATIAYVKPEAAEKYVGMDVTDGKKFTVDSVAITDRNGNSTNIKFNGPDRGVLEIEHGQQSADAERGRGGTPSRSDATGRVPDNESNSIATKTAHSSTGASVDRPSGSVRGEGGANPAETRRSPQVPEREMRELEASRNRDQKEARPDARSPQNPLRERTPILKEGEAAGLERVPEVRSAADAGIPRGETETEAGTGVGETRKVQGLPGKPEATLRPRFVREVLSETPNQKPEPSVSPEATQAYDRLTNPDDENGEFTFGMTIPGIEKLGPAIDSLKERIADEHAKIQNAKSIEDAIFQLQKQHEARQLEDLQLMKAAGGKPEDWEAIYHNQENPKEPLTPEQQDLKQRFVDPIHARNEELFRELRPDATPDDYHVHRVVQGYPSWLDRMMNRKGSGGAGKGNVLSKSADLLKGRTMMALDTPDGRRVVSLKGGDAIDTQTGKSWGAVKTEDDGSRSVGAYPLAQATTKEIEAATKLNYYHNALASEIAENLELERAAAATQYLERLKASPEFADFAIKDNGRMSAPDGYFRTDLPQLRDYFFEKHVAEVLDDLHTSLKSGDWSALEKIGDFLTTSIFMNPLMHIPNIAVHSAVNKGKMGLGGFVAPLQAAQRKAGMRAIDAVMHQNADYIEALKAGAPLQGHRQDLRDFQQVLFEKMGKELEENSELRKTVARAFGYPATFNPVKLWYKLSGKITWVSNDVAYMQHVYSLMDKGSSLQEAIHETSKHIPDYRIPSRVLDSRMLSKFMRYRLFSRFSAYHYGAMKSYGEAMKSAFGLNGAPDTDPHEPHTGGGGGRDGKNWKDIRHGWDMLAAIGFFTFVVYPAIDAALKAVTKDKHATMRRAGAATVPYNVAQMVEGKRTPSQVVESTLSPSVMAERGLGLLYGHDPRTGRAIYDPAAPAGKELLQAGRYAAGSIYPVDQALRMMESPNSRHSSLWSYAGVAFPKRQGPRHEAPMFNKDLRYYRNRFRHIAP